MTMLDRTLTIFITLLVCFLIAATFVGCGVSREETVPLPTANNETEAAADADTPPTQPARQDEENDNDDGYGDGDEDQAAEGDADAAPAPEQERAAEPAPLSDEDAEFRRRHVGAWRSHTNGQSNTRFIFTDEGHAQMGVPMLMLIGHYTIDFETYDMPLIDMVFDAMGNLVEQLFFIEHRADESMVLHPVEPDPDDENRVVRSRRGESVILRRDE
jgi:hypothetical protein